MIPKEHADCALCGFDVAPEDILDAVQGYWICPNCQAVMGDDILTPEFVAEERARQDCNPKHQRYLQRQREYWGPKIGLRKRSDS